MLGSCDRKPQCISWKSYGGIVLPKIDIIDINDIYQPLIHFLLPRSYERALFFTVSV
jgi:hypothetical protein